MNPLRQSCWAGLFWLANCCVVAGVDPGVLPIFVADNHADSLAFLAEHLDLDEPHLLVLVDAHSDATAVSRSDELRRDLRRVTSNEDRRSKVESWRHSGRVQAYNWIEPLLPRPFEQVVWIAAPKLHELKKRRLVQEARDALDSRIEFEPRAGGRLAERWLVEDSQALDGLFPDPRPVVLSLDLDYFTELPEEMAKQEMERIWAVALRWPLLRAVTVAISRPWQRDEAQAALLTAEFFKLAGDSFGGRFHLEHRLRENEVDDSLRAQALAGEGKSVPRWNWQEVPASLAAQLAMLDERLRPWQQDDGWPQLKKRWQGERVAARLEFEGVAPSLDGIWRVGKQQVAEATVHIASLPANATQRTRWWLLQPRSSAYDLLPESGLGKGFTRGASPWVADRRVFLVETSDAALASSHWRQHLDPATGLGRVRLAAELETAAGWMPLPSTEVRVMLGHGFRSGLAEQMGAPYVFGIGLAAAGFRTGAETAAGNDCANFLIHSWRRQGWALPWCSPGQLRPFLQLIQDKKPTRHWQACAIPAEALDRGLVIDLGEHIAALWEDREPVGMLDHDDLVIHHLNGFPAILPLGQLLTTASEVAIRCRPAPPPFLVFGGDVVLAQVDEPEVVAAFASRPQASHCIVNLEGVPSGLKPARGEKPRYDFRFDPARLRWLQEQGVTAVCLANNHALDAGREGLRAGLQTIRQTGLQVFGAGETAEAALTPARIDGSHQRVSLFGVVCLPWVTAADTQPGVCLLPQHRVELAVAMQQEKQAGRTVIVMAHWGEEYQTRVTHEQRDWARWLVEQGADSVIGSHPHVTQAVDAWQGRAIWFSLGNLVFPAALNALGNHQWAVWPRQPD